MALWAATLSTGAAFFPTWEGLVSFNHPESGPVWQGFAGPPNFESGSVALSANVNTDGIVKALNSIAMMDTDISFNNGAAIYSVRGRASS